MSCLEYYIMLAFFFVFFLNLGIYIRLSQSEIIREEGMENTEQKRSRRKLVNPLDKFEQKVRKRHWCNGSNIAVRN